MQKEKILSNCYCREVLEEEIVELEGLKIHNACGGINPRITKKSKRGKK